MAIPESHKKERLHSAYIRAIIAHAEQVLVVDSEGDYGIDGSVRQIQHDTSANKYSPTGNVFDFQLKATITCDRNKMNEVVYSLDSDAHYRFSQWQGIIPSVLIVYDMPDDIQNCVIQDTEKLAMQGCCYWKFMDGDVLKKKTVHIPSNQIFNAAAVNYILGFHGQELRRLRNVSSS